MKPLEKRGGKRNMIWILLILIIAVLLFAQFLFGYTTIRFPYRRKNGKKRIACIGDSITYGCTVPLFFLQRYPAVLQRLLGKEVQVGVFGVNDRTLQSTGNKPYRKEQAFRQSKEFLPDTVVILLGTNDSKDENWQTGEAFVQQYKELIEAYRTLPSTPQIVLCTPPCGFEPIHRLFYVTNDAKLDRIPEIADLVRTVAADEELPLVDLYALTEGRRELFGPDGLHPFPAGASVIADAVGQAIMQSVLMARKQYNHDLS